MNIYIQGTSVVFEFQNQKYAFPKDSLIYISNDISEIVNVRLKASRRNIIQFKYSDCQNISSTSASDLVNKINNL